MTNHSNPGNQDFAESTQDRTANEVDANAAPAADELTNRLKEAEDESARLKDSWLRAKAELENVRKQGQNDVAKAHRYAIERFAQDLLEVKDALEASLATNATEASLRAGVELTLKNLNSAFDKAHVVEINPAGEKYDAHRHQAMTMVESEQAPNTVVQVFQKGYLLNDRVLRPALVSVSKAPEAASPSPSG